jgi:hypothetical protein
MWKVLISDSENQQASRIPRGSSSWEGSLLGGFCWPSSSALGKLDAMSDHPIASIPFLDGTVRPVYLDANGRQFVQDDAGDRVYGTWVYINEPDLVVRSVSD